jgi:hypothetical protein
MLQFLFLSICDQSIKKLSAAQNENYIKHTMRSRTAVVSARQDRSYSFGDLLDCRLFHASKMCKEIVNWNITTTLHPLITMSEAVSPHLKKLKIIRKLPRSFI